MDDSPVLRELIRELQRERSPIERMRILARAWRAVRSLSPAERALLAREAGVEGADRVLSRMGAGVSAAQVLSSLADPPSDDAETVRTLVERIAQPEPPPPPPPSPPPTAPEPPKAEPKPTPEPAPMPPRPAPPPIVFELPPAPPREPAPSASDLVSISSLTLRFRALRERAARSAESAVTLVEAFPDGWARRRAAAQVIREGLVDSPVSLDAVLATLSRESDRAWCRRLHERGVA